MAIAKDWNERGVPTSTGAPWRRATIRDMLCSGRISGRREHHGEIVGPAEWPAIIDVATSDRLRAVMRRPRSEPSSRPQRFLLSGLLRCGLCGTKLAGRPHRSGMHRFRCDDGGGGCGRVGVGTAPTEAFLRDAVCAAANEPRTARAVRRRTGRSSESRVQQALQKIAADEAKLGELGEMWDAGEITRAEWLRLRATIETRLEEARRQAATTDDAAVEWLGRGEALAAAWDDLPLHRRQAITRALIDRVVVHPPTNRGRFDPARLEIVWRG